jgi:hypothetical protein
LEVSSSKLNFQISLVKADDLKPHEEVIDTIVRTLANDIAKEGEVRDPLIVDRHDLVILDGMHRFSSLKQLNCRFIPCCLVDYDSPLIRVGSWFRLFRVHDEEATAQGILREAGLDFSTMKVASLHYDPQAIILTRTGDEFLMPQPADPFERARTAVALEKIMVKKGYDVEYLSEIVALEELRSPGKVNLVISMPIFTKEQIREYGLAGHLLPHKVTRHVIPSRPLRINIPLRMLKGTDVSLEEANRKLGHLLARRQINRKPPGSVVEGRRYEEELLIFTI